MRANEIQRFAEQARKTQKKAEQYRAAAESVEDEIDKARLNAAANAIEINGLEWIRVASELAR